MALTINLMVKFDKDLKSVFLLIICLTKQKTPAIAVYWSVNQHPALWCTFLSFLKISYKCNELLHWSINMNNPVVFLVNHFLVDLIYYLSIHGLAVLFCFFPFRWHSLEWKKLSDSFRKSLIIVKYHICTFLLQRDCFILCFSLMCLIILKKNLNQQILLGRK